MPLYHLPASTSSSSPVTGSWGATGAYFGGFGGTVGAKNGLTTSYFVRVFVPRAMTVDRIGLEVTTFAATSTIRLAMYTDVADIPTALILDAGTIDSTTNGFKEITISQALNPGWVWLGACALTATNPTVRSLRTAAGHGYHGTAATYSGFAINGFSSATWTNGAAAPAGPITPANGTEDGPRILLRAA